MTGPRPLLILVLIVLVTASLSGCLRDRGRDAGEDDPVGQELLVTLVMVDPPQDIHGQVLDLTVDHLALYDSGRDEWVPLLGRPYDTALFLEEGLSDPALLTAIPILSGDYVTLEMIVSEARLSDDDGGRDLEVASVACYIPVSLTVEADAVIELELYLAGDESFSATTDGWRFQPALSGSLTDHGNGDAHFDDPDCQAIGTG